MSTLEKPNDSDNKKDNENNIPQNENKENISDDEGNKSGSDIETQINTYPMKITIIGSTSVGKTSIIKRYFENKFELNSTEATISAIYHNKKIKTDPFTEANMQIWDTAGQEKYRSITKNYFLNANGIIIVFDLSDEKSFNDLNFWMEEINNTLDEQQVALILVGNKSDLTSDIKIDNATALNYAKEHNMKYLSVSAKDGVNIEHLFEIIGSDCIKKIQEEQKRLEEEDLDKNNNKERFSAMSGQFENNLNNEKIILPQNNDDVINNKKKIKCC